MIRSQLTKHMSILFSLVCAWRDNEISWRASESALHAWISKSMRNESFWSPLDRTKSKILSRWKVAFKLKMNLNVDSLLKSFHTLQWADQVSVILFHYLIKLNYEYSSDWTCILVAFASVTRNLSCWGQTYLMMQNASICCYSRTQNNF